MFNRKKYMKEYLIQWRKKNPDKVKEQRKRAGKKHWKKYSDEYRIICKDLKSNGCAICGYNKYYGALDFHHSNPKDKKFQVGLSTIERKSEKWIEEINKCVLLCKNCHAEIERRNERRQTHQT